MEKRRLSTYQKRSLLNGVPKICAYCGITEQDCRDFFEKHLEFTRGRHRGFHLEVDRINSALPYSENNVVWACYPCNNSKSNYCNTAVEFDPIAKGIRKIWQDRGYFPK